MKKKLTFWTAVLITGIMLAGCNSPGSNGNSGGGRKTVKNLSGTWAGEGEGVFFKLDNGNFESHFNKGTYKVSGSTIAFKTTQEWSRSKHWIAANYEFSALINQNGNSFTLSSSTYTKMYIEH